MKYLMTCTLGALLAASCAGAADVPPKSAPRAKEAAPSASAAELIPAIYAGPPCIVARAVAAQLGRLAPQVKPLPNAQAFGAANGGQKLVVACGLSADETYTYNRLLTTLGIGLLAFNGDETPQKVVQELAGRLKLSYQHSALAKLPVSYIFPGAGPNAKAARFTIVAAGTAKATPAAKPAVAAHAAASTAAAKTATAQAAAPKSAPAASTATRSPAAPVATARSTVQQTPPAPTATARSTAQQSSAAPAATTARSSAQQSPAAPAVTARSAAAQSPAAKTAGARIAAAYAPPAAPPRETLLDLYQLAKASDPDLGRARSRYLGSQADTELARSALRPRVNADVGLSYIDQTSITRGTPSLQSTVLGFNYDVVASAPLLHFSSRFNLASAKAAERGEEAGVTATRQGLILRLTQAYFGLLKTQGDDVIARDEISRVKQALEQAQAFLQAGTGDIIAVYEAQARLDSVLADLNRSESSLTLARQRLSAIVGKVVPAIADQLPKRPIPPDPNDIEWWLATMEKSDPQIRQAQEGLVSSAEQTKSAKSDHLPVIDATGGFDVNKGAAFDPSAETRQWHLGATVTLPLYSGGETSARVRRASANETERRYALDQVREQRRDNVKQAFFNLRYAVSLIRSLEQREASALVQLNAIRKGRSIGTRTAIDLLNAEQAYSVAQRDLKNAMYDNVVRVVELKAAAGILSEQDLARD